MFDAIVFDNDGLLLDTEVAWTRAETTLFARHGGEFTDEHKRSLLGSSGPAAAAKLEAMLHLPGRGRELLDALHELVMEEALAGVPPRPGALELLRAVREAGVPVGLASNSSREFVERVLSVAGLLDGHFDAIVTADDVERPKPAPDIYLAACAELGAAPSRSAALEDSVTGVTAARAAGLFVVAVPYFPDASVDGASLRADSLADPRVARALLDAERSSAEPGFRLLLPGYAGTVADEAPNTNPEKDPDDWVTGEEPMTGPQASYLQTLCQEAGEDFDENLTKAEASQRIEELQQRTGRGSS